MSDSLLALLRRSSEGRQSGEQIPTPPLESFVTLAESPNLSVPHCLIRKM